MSSLRVGQGFDAHRLVPGRRLLLGGVEIPYERGLEGHSDGDCLIHAVCDALLGAAGLGDMGAHFPSSDARWRGADSRVFLTEVGRLLAAAGCEILNLDATVVAEAPCPGSAEIRTPHPEDIVCFWCDARNEIWSDESEVNCKNCGKQITRDMKPSCILWCPAAKECVGVEKYERLIKAMKD